MKFAWPFLLWLLVFLPFFIWLYFRRPTSTLRKPKDSFPRPLSSLYGLEDQKDDSSHKSSESRFPAILFFCGIALLLAASARPHADLTAPRKHETLVFAVDCSGSMEADDIPPTRLLAVKKAVKLFIGDLPSSTRVGLVAFASDAQLAAAPSSDRHQVVVAIDALFLQSATAIGDGILTSLKAIFPEDEFPQQLQGDDSIIEFKPPAPIVERKPVGSYKSAAIVLLTDGESTNGIAPLDAAKFAAERGVRVFTIGVGTEYGITRMGSKVGIDEKTLQDVAELTGGEYFRAVDVESFTAIYKSLDAKLILTRQWEEVTFIFVITAFFLLLLSVGLSLFRWGRIL